MRRSIVLVIAPAIMATALIAARRDDTQLSGAALDFADDPVSVAVDLDGDVLVGLRTDVASGVVRRFSASGALRSATAWSGALEPLPFVAEGPAGTTFVAQSMADEIAVVDAAGVVGKRWAVPFPQLPQGFSGMIASDLFTRPVSVTVFALADSADGRRVVRYAADGREMSRWPVEGSAYDLAVGLAADGEPRVHVVVHGRFGGTSRVMAHRLDGTVDEDVDADGEVVGIDTTIGGVPRMIVRPELSTTAHLDVHNGPLIAGDPSDLAVAPNGDLFVVSHVFDRLPGVVLRYTGTGCLIETWPSELLNGSASAAPTPGASPCPGQDATPTPHASPSSTPPPSSPSPSATISGTAPVAPTPQIPTAPPPTSTLTPTGTAPVIIDRLPAYLPIARTNKRLDP